MLCTVHFAVGLQYTICCKFTAIFCCDLTELISCNSTVDPSVELICVFGVLFIERSPELPVEHQSDQNWSLRDSTFYILFIWEGAICFCFLGSICYFMSFPEFCAKLKGRNLIINITFICYILWFIVSNAFLKLRYTVVGAGSFWFFCFFLI